MCYNMYHWNGPVWWKVNTPSFALQKCARLIIKKKKKLTYWGLKKKKRFLLFMSIKMSWDECFQTSSMHHGSGFGDKSISTIGIITAVDHVDHFTYNVVINDVIPAVKHCIFWCHTCIEQFKVPAEAGKTKQKQKTENIHVYPNCLRVYIIVSVTFLIIKKQKCCLFIAHVMTRAFTTCEPVTWL